MNKWTVFFLSCLAATASAQSDDTPYDQGKVTFHNDWCSPPQKDSYGGIGPPFDTSEIMQICSGGVLVGADEYYPGAVFHFKNGKSLTLGCLNQWQQIDEHLTARQCSNAYGTFIYVLYDQMDIKGQTAVNRAW